MSAIVVVIPSARGIARRFSSDAGLREQFQRECDALEQAMHEPPPRTRPIALPSLPKRRGS
jgi:hypothetical protein